MEKKQKKLIVILSLAITIFTIGIVFKAFQNDTFFNIAIGKHILENGIDMQEHFTWAEDDLYYSHSHWLFDIVTYLIYSQFGFLGIYLSIIIFTTVIGITLFILLTKRNKSPIISFFITLMSLYIIKDCFTARSQIVSFLCFILEIYCIEQFIETNKKKYAIVLIISSIAIANFHAATWPLTLVLFMPYFASSFFNVCSSKYIYGLCIKRLEKKISKLPKDSEKINDYKKDIEDYKKIIGEKKPDVATYKVIRRENYNSKNLIILFILIALTGLLTPIHGTPYTYIIKSMFGPSNFENTLSIDYINEMQPIIPISNLGFMVYTAVLITFLTFLPTKLKTEHSFLLAGLYLMSLMSGRYVFLLVLLGAFPLNDLIVQATNNLIPDDIELSEKFFAKTWVAIVLCLFIGIFTTSSLLTKMDLDYVNKKEYPVGAVDYIKENLDYKNIKIYNSYNNGSYLMLNEIPVFLDSRLDVYCSEFNDTDIFYDFIQLSTLEMHYEDIFNKYDFTHILLLTEEKLNKLIERDSNYTEIYSDEYYVLYEKNN